jgi:hypothetical protein
MELSASRYVLEHCLIEAIPVQPGSLAASPQRMPPSAADFGTEAIQSEQVRGHGIVSEIALCNTVQPSANDRHRFVPSSEKRLPNRSQRCSHSLLHRYASHSKATLTVLSAAVGEAEEVEGFRFPVTPGATTFSREAAEFNRPRFIRMQR